MSHNGKLTNSTGWNAIFSWIKYALTGKRDNTQAVQDTEVSAESLVDLNARVEALEKVLSSLNVDDAEDLSIYKVLQSEKTFSPDRTKTLSAMSQNDNGEMSATFAEVQATVVSQNNYTSPGSTKTALSTIFGKIWNFFGMLLESTGTWNGSSNAQIPTTAAVQAKLDEKQGLVGINSSSGDPLKLLNQKGEWVTSPALVDVTSYTSYSSITAVASDGAQPYYAHTDGSLVVYLMYVGVSTPTGPGQSVALVFCGVSNGSIYRTSFTNGGTSFAQVSKTPVFSSDNVIDSSSQSAWSTDDINVPTRAAVEAKIASAITGDIGGLLGGVSPSALNWYILNGFNFKKGDWFVASDSGDIYYYPQNDRNQTQLILSVDENQEVYWTADGFLVARPDTSMHVYGISSLEDWNTLNVTGVYAIESQASGVANGPGSGSGGRIVCYVTKTNGRIIQLAVSSKVWRRQSDNSGSFSNAAWKTLAFNDEIADLVSKTGTYNSSSNPFALQDYVDTKTTNIPKVNLDSYVQASLERADSALTGAPQGVTNGSGVVQSYRGAIIFVLLVQSDITGVPVISGAVIDGKLCFNIKSFIEYKINSGDRKNHQVYAILNTCGSDVYFTKGTSSDSASSADHVLLKNERFIFVGCYGGSTTLLNNDYYLQ